MSEAGYDTGPPPAAPQSADGGIRLNPGFIRTPPGLLLLINLVSLLLHYFHSEFPFMPVYDSQKIQKPLHFLVM